MAYFLRVLLVFLHLSCVPDDCRQEVAALVVVLGSGMFRRRLVDFAGDDAFRAVFPGLSAFLGRKRGWLRSSSVSGSGMNGFADIFAPRAVFPTIDCPSPSDTVTNCGSRFTFHRRGLAASCYRSWYSVPQIMGNCGGDSETVQFPDKVIAMFVVLRQVQFPG